MNIDQLESHDFFGASSIVPCTRCGVPCRVAAPRNPDARLLAFATEETVKAGRGLCVNCGTTEFLKLVLEADRLLAMTDEGKQHGARAFLAPHVQNQFNNLLRTGHADARPEEVNWALVVEHWDLPFPKAKRKRRSVSKPGGAP